ncbi:hypothetical protein DINM_004848 [Dirofilaria immitis]|nr:hypothetical protein [Dirofilaria immitis]
MFRRPDVRLRKPTKKQLSPALQLQDDINSFCVLMNWYVKASPKRSSGDQPYVLPVMNLDNLLSLQNIGKRPALSPADQFIQQFDVRNLYPCKIMQHLMAAGKKISITRNRSRRANKDSAGVNRLMFAISQGLQKNTNFQLIAVAVRIAPPAVLTIIIIINTDPCCGSYGAQLAQC